MGRHAASSQADGSVSFQLARRRPTASRSARVRRPTRRCGRSWSSRRPTTPTRARAARRRCACRWCRPTRRAPRRTASHGPPLEHPSCNPPVRESTALTVGTPDANGLRGELERISCCSRPIAGNPATPEDEADVALAFQLTDVRHATGLLRTTTQASCSSGPRCASPTGRAPRPVRPPWSDLVLPVTVPCAATLDPLTGGECSIATTARRRHARGRGRGCPRRSGSWRASRCTTAAPTATPRPPEMPCSRGPASSFREAQREGPFRGRSPLLGSSRRIRRPSMLPGGRRRRAAMRNGFRTQLSAAALRAAAVMFATAVLTLAAPRAPRRARRCRRASSSRAPSPA